MSQRYTHPTAQERMARDLCPECGQPAWDHTNEVRFWVPRACDLLPQGVTDRIAQYRADQEVPS